MADDQIKIEVRRTDTLSPDDKRDVNALFAANYDAADLSYIDQSIDTLKYVAVAVAKTGLVGFGFGETRIAPLPRLSDNEVIALAGISCVDPNVRQRGLFSQMAAQVLSYGGNLPTDRPYLFCGRMAHAMSYRTIAKITSALAPRADEPLTAWRQETLLAAASEFGVAVDQTTGIVRGRGRPVGYPKLQFEPTPDEERLFRDVDRSNGDSLLTVAWIPTAPAGW